MKVLSILWSTGSTAALMIDGEIIACVSEERFTRVKNEDMYPYHAINSVLALGGVDPKELDMVVFAGNKFDAAAILCHKYSRFSIRDRLKEQDEYWYKRLIEKKEVSYLKVFNDKLDTRQYPGDWKEVLAFLEKGREDNIDEFFKDFRCRVISRHLGINPKKIIFAHHHRAHGYYAYYGSPMPKNKTLIFTADGWGDDMNASVSLADKGNIRSLKTSQNFIIGRLYRYITLLLGMKPDEHEYKVMGLAAYAKEKYYQEPLSVLKKTMYVDGLGFAYKEVPPDLYFYFRDKFEGYRFDSIAGALQQYTQDILTQWVRNAIKATHAGRVCFGGGVAMNIKALMKIADLPETKEIFVCPTPSDESLAIGAAYVAMHDIYVAKKEDPTKHLKPLKTAYLGPQASPHEVDAVVKSAREKGYAVRHKPKPQYLAGLLNKGWIIGRCAGRSEFGARALGNRSILTDPRNLDIIQVINEKIKCRDFWMPFSPTLLDKKADAYLVNGKKLNAPYMTIAFETRPLAQKHLKAAVHQYDLTVRPQILTRETNYEYYRIIEEFEKLTGVSGVLNTSFNIHGEPIVQTPEDALRVFERSEIDALLLDGFLIKRKKHK